MDAYQRSKQVRRAKQNDANAKIRQALRGTNPHTANLVFDLSKGEQGNKIDKNRRAHAKAIEVVSGLLSSFALPMRPRFEFNGIRKNAVDESGNISEGVIKIGVILHTMLNHKARIDVPVIVKNGSIIEPAVFFYNDAPYVMCAPALEELVRAGSLRKETQPRGMFSAPSTTDVTSADLPTQPIVNQEHMFSPGPRNPFTFRRQYNKEAQHKAEPRKRTNIDTPTEMPELWNGDVQDEMLDPSERRREKLFEPGAKVKMSEDFQARERGGGHLIIPKGESGVVMKDQEGDGKMLYVCFEALGMGAHVPKRMLKSAARMKKLSQIGGPEYIQESYVIEHPAGLQNAGYRLGASSGEGMVFYDHIDGQWSPFDSSEASAALANQLTEESWMAHLAADAVPFREVMWTKTAAATTDQVKNEVRQMLREGYQVVDIKEAIKRRYPEQSTEALQGLN